MHHLQGIILTGNTPIPAPVMSMAPCRGVTVNVTAMEEDVNPEVIWTVPVLVENPTMVMVTHAAPHLQGGPHHPMVAVVEAVAMTTMAAVPGMAMAVATVTPAVGVTRTPLAAESELAGRRGGPLPRSREATLLVKRTAAQVAGLPEGAEGAVGSIEEWPAADTEMDLEIKSKSCVNPATLFIMGGKMKGTKDSSHTS